MLPRLTQVANGARTAVVGRGVLSLLLSPAAILGCAMISGLPHQRAHAALVPIANNSFETPAIGSVGHRSHVIPDGWVGNAVQNSMGTTYLIRNFLNPVQRFPGLYPQDPDFNGPNGKWVQLQALRSSPVGEAWISQNLGAENAIGAGVYTLSLYAGFDATSAGLQANYGGSAQVFGRGGYGEPLTTIDIPPDSLTPGEFTLLTSEFTIPAGDPVIGTNLVLRLAANQPPLEHALSSTVISYDGITLDFAAAGVEAVPEPGAVSLIVMGAVACWRLRRRRHAIVAASALSTVIVLSTASPQAFAVEIPIVNGSFQLPGIGTAAHRSHVLPDGWTGNAVQNSIGSTFVIRNALTTPKQRFPSLFPGDPEGNGAAGQWVQLLANRDSTFPQNVLFQDLGPANAAAAGTYTFSLYAGFDNTSDGAQDNRGGRASILPVAEDGSVGAPLIAFEFAPDALAVGEFTQFSGEFTLSEGDPAIGANLLVQLEADQPIEGGRTASVISFDGIALDFDAGGATSSPDFDDDGDVDGADLLTWQQGVGLTGQPDNSTGDATGDGNVDGLDLEAWRSGFGSAASLVHAVPEPSGMALLALGGACSTVGRFRGRRICRRADSALRQL